MPSSVPSCYRSVALVVLGVTLFASICLAIVFPIIVPGQSLMNTHVALTTTNALWVATARVVALIILTFLASKLISIPTLLSTLEPHKVEPTQKI